MKKRIFLWGLFFLLPLWATAQEALRLHHQQEDRIHSTMLDEIRRITFSQDELLLQSAEVETLYSFDQIRSITFGEYLVGDDDPSTSVAKSSIDALVYVNPLGEIRVESSVAVQSLSLFSTNGKLLSQSSSESISAGSLPKGVYILLVETQQGNLSKKIIKK